MKAFIGIAALLVAMAIPGATAEISTHDQFRALDIILPPEAQGQYAAVPEFYIADNGDIWQESNDVAGLQMEPVLDEEGNEVAPADSYVAGFASLPF